jgi:hypothetical protein
MIEKQKINYREQKYKFKIKKLINLTYILKKGKT